MTTTMIHPFEQSGLGKAPFTYVGLDNVDGDRCNRNRFGEGTCDHCGTTIKDSYNVLSADGKVFGVGCDCIRKVDAVGKAKLSADLKAKNNAKADARIAEARITLGREDIRSALASKPHPAPWAQAKGLTLLNQVEWLLANGGRTGKTDAAKIIERTAKGLA